MELEYNPIGKTTLLNFENNGAIKYFHRCLNSPEARTATS